MLVPAVNLDQLALQSIAPVSSLVNTNAQVDKTVWKPSYEITSLTLPQIADYPTMKKRFKIQFTVFDSQSKRSFSKTLFFGSEDDYCFTQNKSQRLKKIQSLKNHGNPMHPDYWRAHICFNGDDWIQNTVQLCRKYLSQKAVLLKKLKPKKDFAPLIKKREQTMIRKGLS